MGPSNPGCDASALASTLLPLTRAVAHVKVSGLENLKSLRGPVIFAANHQSYLDTPIILASLPSCWRYGLAPAMWKKYFDACFHPDRYSPREHLAKGALYRLLALLFNAFPVPQTETGTRESVRYMGELVEEGWSILIFPEGERTLTGAIGHFYPGVGMIASRLRVPVVPIRLTGLIGYCVEMRDGPGRVRSKSNTGRRSIPKGETTPPCGVPRSVGKSLPLRAIICSGDRAGGRSGAKSLTF